jgi:hypothetical protein
MTEPTGSDQLLAAIADEESIRQPLVDDADAIAAEERLALATDPADDEPGEQHPDRTS